MGNSSAGRARPGIVLIGLAAALAGAEALAQAALEEIVVTAQRREETLQSVPVAVTAITARDLKARGIRDYSSYLTTVPGAGLQETTGIGGEIKFRGVGTGTNAQLSPTTAVYFGDVPVIHTGRNVNASYNFWLADLERIEVLRGPQGQLYGANSLGGAIKNVPARPDFGSFGASIELSGGSISRGGTDWLAQGMINVPVGERFALRAVGYRVEQAGWYDNVFRGGPALGTLPVPPPGAPGSLLPLVIALQPAAAAYAAPAPERARNVNTTDITGGRLLLSWGATDRLDVLLMLVAEQKEYGGAAFAEYPNPTTFPPFVPVPSIDFRRYQHNEGTTAGGGDEIRLANLVLDYDFGAATLTSSTSFWERDEQLDLSLSISSFPIAGVPDAVPITNYRSDNPQVFTQELRLTSSGASRLDWLAGLFYQQIDQRHRIFAVDESGLDLRYYTQVALAQLLGFPPPATRTLADNQARFEDEQLALFGQLGYGFTERLRGALSFRWFTLDQSFEQTTRGFQFGVAQGFQSGTNSEDVFTPRFELSYSPAQSRMYYASAAEGFRTGIINRALPQLDCGAELVGIGYPGGLPPTRADTVRNYEVGAKLDLLGRRLRLNAAAYYTDWKDMQLNVPLSAYSPDPTFSTCPYDAVINAGDATTRGVELEAAAALGDALRLDLALSYTDAQFESTIPQLNIARGDAIPLTPDFTSYLGLQWQFRLGALPAFARAEWQYVGEKEPLRLDFPPFQYPGGVPFDVGNYSQVNLRAGVDLTAAVRVEVFGDNVLDELGITSTNTTGGIGYPFVTTIRPRTVGATLRWRF